MYHVSLNILLNDVTTLVHHIAYCLNSPMRLLHEHAFSLSQSSASIQCEKCKVNVVL